MVAVSAPHERNTLLIMSVRWRSYLIFTLYVLVLIALYPASTERASMVGIVVSCLVGGMPQSCTANDL